MLDYAKAILPKVCFWDELFKKEILKCVNWTNSDELNELRDWCHDNFNDMYPDILAEVFDDEAFNKKYMGMSKTSYSGNSKEKQLKYRKVAHSLPIQTY